MRSSAACASGYRSCRRLSITSDRSNGSSDLSPGRRDTTARRPRGCRPGSATVSQPPAARSDRVAEPEVALVRGQRIGGPEHRQVLRAAEVFDQRMNRHERRDTEPARLANSRLRLSEEGQDWRQYHQPQHEEDDAPLVMQLPVRNPGSTCMASRESVTMRMPFLRIVTGKTAAITQAFVHESRRNM